MIHDSKGEVFEMGENVKRKYVKLHYINVWHVTGILFFIALIWRQQIYVKKTYVLSHA